MSKEIKIQTNFSIDDDFVITSFEEMENKSGIYCFYDDKDELIYIGKSIKIKERIYSHMSPKEASKAYRYCKYIKVCYVDADSFSLMALEYALIHLYRPKLNKNEGYQRELVTDQQIRNIKFYVKQLKFPYATIEKYCGTSKGFIHKIKTNQEYGDVVVPEDFIPSVVIPETEARPDYARRYHRESAG